MAGNQTLSQRALVDLQLPFIHYQFEVHFRLNSDKSNGSQFVEAMRQLKLAVDQAYERVAEQVERDPSRVELPQAFYAQESGGILVPLGKNLDETLRLLGLNTQG